MDRPQRSETEQQQFFDNCLAKYQDAKSKVSEYKLYFEIAETVVCLSFAGNSLIEKLTAALKHLQIDFHENPDLTINVWDSKSSEVEMVSPPCQWKDFTDRGDIWGFNSNRIKTAFHWSEYSVNVFDLSTNVAVYWVKNPDSFPYWVFSSPFRTIFHWWMEKNNCQLVHAAAVGTENGGVLITGKGGSGKSTIALSCLKNNLQYLGDDYVIIKQLPEPTIFSIYSSAKINVVDIEKFKEFESSAMLKIKLNQEKDVIFLHPKFENRICKKIICKAILTPNIQTTDKPFFKPISFWQIQKAMSFTTMSQLPNVGSHTIEFINSFISKLPCFQFIPGNKFDSIPHYVSRFLENPEQISEIANTQTTENQIPLISFVVPVFNAEKYIAQAIENIVSQDYPAIEIIVVDDGSTDKTREMVENLRIDIRYFFQENAGPATARNRGIREASAEFIAFLDADDLFPENNLKMLTSEMLENPELDLVRGFAQLFSVDHSGKMELIGNPKESFPNYIGAALYRKSVFTKVGLFDAELRFGEDDDWFHRATEKRLKMKRLEQVTLLVRRHDENMTKGKDFLELNALKVFKKKIDRMRTEENTQQELQNMDTINNKKKISVIIPVFNAEKYIEDAIESALNQNYEPIEIIVVDDGSTDNSSKIIKNFGEKITYIYQENSGVSTARNAGLKASTGDFIAFLDADDYFYKEKFSVQLSQFDKYQLLGITFGFVSKNDYGWRYFDNKSVNESNKLFLLQLGSTLISRKVFDDVGYFDEDLKLSEDLDFFLRIKEKNIPIAIHPEAVQFHRTHETNITNDKKKVNYYHFLTIKKALKRREKFLIKSDEINLQNIQKLEEAISIWHTAKLKNNITN